MNMHNSAHPGEIFVGWIDDLDLSMTSFAKHLGISRIMLSRIINGHAAVSTDMDLRLSEALDSTPGFWLQMLSATCGLDSNGQMNALTLRDLLPNRDENG